MKALVILSCESYFGDRLGRCVRLFDTQAAAERAAEKMVVDAGLMDEDTVSRDGLVDFQDSLEPSEWFEIVDVVEDEQ